LFSLRPGWVFLVVFIYVIGIFLGSTYDNQNTVTTWAGSGSGATATAPSSTLGSLAQMQEAKQQSSIVGSIQLITNPTFWNSVYKMSTWQFSFLYDENGNMTSAMFYWICLFPFVAMFALCMLIMLISILRGNITFG
jgi:hypothetical protein